MRAASLFSIAVFLLQIHLFSKHSGGPLKELKSMMLPRLEGPVAHLAVDVKNQRIFLAATSNNTIEVYDAQRLTHLSTISGLAQPQDVVFLPDSGNLLVSNGADGSLRTYDGQTLKLLDSKLLGGDADHIGVVPGSQTVCVGWGVGGLAMVDMTSGRRSNITLSSHPESFQLDSSGNRIYVNLPGVSQIVEIDRRSRTVFASWPLHPYRDNGPMALDEANRRIFVVCRKPAKLLVLNMDDDAVMASMSTVGDAGDVFFDREHKRIYVIGGEGFVDVFQQKSADDYSVLSHTITMPGARTGLFVPEWNRVYVVARNRPPFDTAEIFSFGIAD
jgi:DNA-binding beta-propeller fold protein YncE